MELLTVLSWGIVFMKLAFVMINTVPDQMESVLEKIEKVDGVKEAYMLYGVYDIIAMVETKTIKKLREVVLSIRTAINIKSTLTLTVVR